MGYFGFISHPPADGKKLITIGLNQMIVSGALGIGADPALKMFNVLIAHTFRQNDRKSAEVEIQRSVRK